MARRQWEKALAWREISLSCLEFGMGFTSSIAPWPDPTRATRHEGTTPLMVHGS